jgi:hypothetical protein
MQQQFPIVPPPASASWPVLLGAAIMLLAAGFFVFLSYSLGRETFSLSASGLSIAGGIYGRDIPAARLIPDEARAVDLTLDAGYHLRSRRNGTGLPGYQSGWFSTDHGKALAFVTDKRRVAAVPTRDGYTVLLSVADPAEFVRVLKSTVKP